MTNAANQIQEKFDIISGTQIAPSIRYAWTMLDLEKEEFIAGCIELGIHPKTARIQTNQAIKEDAEMDALCEED